MEDPGLARAVHADHHLGGVVGQRRRTDLIAERFHWLSGAQRFQDGERESLLGSRTAAVHESGAAHGDVLADEQRRFLAGALGARVDAAGIRRVFLRITSLDAVEDISRRDRRQPRIHGHGRHRRDFHQICVQEPCLARSLLAGIDVGHSGCVDHSVRTDGVDHLDELVGVAEQVDLDVLEIAFAARRTAAEPDHPLTGRDQPRHHAAADEPVRASDDRRHRAP